MIVILNFKTYAESTGENAISLAEAAYNFSKSSNHKVIICPQLIDIENVKVKFEDTENFEVWAQHVDNVRGDKKTGFTTVETIKSIGIKGSLVNHAEHKINEIGKYSDIDDEISLCFCVSNILELKIAINKNPDFQPKYIAFEPPELIGGDISVAKANPMDIEKITEQFSGQSILVGAGIKDNNDVIVSKKLGAKGILIASGYVFAKDKEKFLKELMRGV